MQNVRKRLEEIMTLPLLTAWLEKQPPDISYNPVSNGQCLIAQYIRAQMPLEHDVLSVGVGNLTIDLGGYGEVTRYKHDAALEDVAWGQVRHAETHHFGGVMFTGRRAPWAEERALLGPDPRESEWFTYGEALKRARLISKEDVK